MLIGSSKKLVVMIVPKLPPEIDGLGDYAMSLAKKLRQEFGINTWFIVCDPFWRGDLELEGFQISQIATHSSSALLEKLKNFPANVSVLVNYVLHAYSAKGCPFWLVDALKAWRRESAGATLITMFHEAYADLRGPWSTDFWLQPLQRNLSNALAQASDHVLTTCHTYLACLQQSSKKRHQIDVLPIPSNVGEIAQPLLLSKRQPRLVIFGKSGNKANAYRALVKTSSILNKIGIQEIYDIGQSADDNVKALGLIPIIRLGMLSERDISAILSNSLLGFLAYRHENLAKSGIFASYCSHGLVSLNCRSVTSIPKSSLIPGHHYMVSESQELDIDALQLIADRAYSWYQDHNKLRHATVIANKINSRVTLIV
jgi:hypothetical protein